MHICQYIRQGWTVAALLLLPLAAHATTFTVTSTDDDGTGTLRQAILAANASPGPDTIVFNIAPGGLQTIQPLTPLPDITDPVTLDATTQPGYSGMPLIELDGSQSATSDIDGLRLLAPNCAVRGLVINRFGNNGITVGADNALIELNFIGTDAGGGFPLGGAVGVQIESAAGATVRNNTLSGNGLGLWIDGANGRNLVTANVIGADFSGSIAVPNYQGVEIDGGSGNTLDGNLISGNFGAGITLGTATTGNTLQNNVIGLDIYSQAMPNAGDGIEVSDGSANLILSNQIDANVGAGISLHGATTSANNVQNNDIEANTDGIALYDGATTNCIGGASSVQGNVIVANLEDGISIHDAASVSNKIQYNDIESNGQYGVSVYASSTQIKNNTITDSGLDGVIIGSDDGVTFAKHVCIGSNSIFDNGDLGIRLQTDGVTGKIGGNDLQPAPVLSLAVGNAGATTVTGSLTAAPSTKYQVQIFANINQNPSGYGEGKTLLGTIGVTTDAGGSAIFGAVLPGIVGGQYVAATAKAPNNNTSAFSNAIPIGDTNPGPTLTDLSPGTATIYNTGLTLTINGANFVPNSAVQWNGVSLTTKFISPTQLKGTVPASYLAAASTAQITVFNPLPGGGISNTLPFTVNNPVPAISMLAPDNATAGGTDFTLTVNGASFVPGATVLWNGVARSTTYVSAGQLTAAIAASDLAVGGTAQVSVFNPAPGGGISVPLAFTINNPVPSLIALSQTRATAGNPAITITLTGTNFVPTSTVQWNGSARATTYASATLLTVALTADDLKTPGSYPITVVNPAPGGGASSGLAFAVIGIPQLSVASASATRSGNTVTVTCALKNFSTADIVGGQLILARLGRSSTLATVPIPIGTIAAGSTGNTLTLDFPGALIPTGKQVFIITVRANGQSLNASSLVAVP